MSHSGTHDEEPGARKPIRTFGRLAGRPLSARQQALFDTLLPNIEAPAAPEASLDPHSLFETPKTEIWFEIGFGGGEHLAGQAQRHPDVGFIGVEPFIEGFAKALTAVSDMSLENVRLHQGDARGVLAGLTDASLDRVFIMFPDPWPKARHHKRRLIQDAFLILLARKVRPGGRVRFATDWANYADWTLERFTKSADFEWMAQSADDWRTPPADHVTTRYQEKRLGDCDPVWFDFQRR